MYVGALSALLDMDVAEIERLIGEQFKGKGKLITANNRALQIGRDHVLKELKCPLGLRLKRAEVVGDRVFIDGNSAAALGCVYGGATVAAWYPITPSTSLAEAFMRFCRRYRTDPVSGKNKHAIIQAEDELASIGMVIGAAWNGARAFTTTSGPGISLMQEFIGLAYFAEVPAVIFDIQRGGPSTGMPTRTQQSDILTCAYASHGDTKHVLLLPADPHECFAFAALSFDLADRLQTPIFVMLDLDIGMNEWLSAPFAWDDSRRMDRGKVMDFDDLEAGREFGRYRDVDDDGVTYRTYPGTHPTRGAFFTRGSSKDAFARYTEEGAAYVENMQRLQKKFRTACNFLPPPVLGRTHKSAHFGVIYYGSTAPAMEEALDALEDHGAVLDIMRLRAFPFHDEVAAFIARYDKVFVVEQNRDGQMRMLLVNECNVDPNKLIPILHYDGTPITARFIIREIAGRLAALNVRPFRKVIA
jgi:2-oxoglutarate ferredoxin oxidoreductase subunit alpha